MSTGTYWQRFLAAGEHLATREPDFFPTVVELLTAMAWPGANDDDDNGESALRAIVQAAFVTELPACAAEDHALTASQLADVLVHADPSLCDIPDLASQIASLAVTERTVAMTWARAHFAAQLDGSEDMPTMPACIGALYAQLLPGASSKESDPCPM